MAFDNMRYFLRKKLPLAIMEKFLPFELPLKILSLTFVKAKRLTLPKKFIKMAKKLP
jgi:hypothetical protein